MNLAERWPLPGHGAVRDRLLAAWDRPGYHDLRHLAEVLDRLDDLRDAGAAFEEEVVRLAAWFHDAVYDDDPAPEERSAQWAEQVLPDGIVDEVARLVRLTETHRPEQADANGAALCDADLAILAAGEERYAEYVDGVRRDFASVPEAAFIAGRLAVLAQLQEKPALFDTSQGRELWESAARANLAREIAALRAS